MSDCISREAAIKAFEEARYDVSEPCGNDGFSFDKVENVLQSIPAADMKPVARGTWIRTPDKKLGHVQYVGMMSRINSPMKKRTFITIVHTAGQ